MHGDDSAEVREEFNKASGSVRFVSILSPTCPMCVKGHGVVREIFEDVKSDKLKGFLVWLPMKANDNARTAFTEARSWKDPRVLAEGWDSEREVGNQFSKTLKLRGSAWDVYLVYKPGVRWEGDLPPAPTFWMHQLRADVGADQKQCLNASRLKKEIRKILASPS